MPLSRASRGQLAYIKLLRRMDPRSRSPFSWQGWLLKPGTEIAEGELWPDGTYPRIPLLLEHAGASKPAKGWNRHKSDNTVVLWRYDPPTARFLEIGRVEAPGGTWAMLMEPLIRDWLLKDADPETLQDLELLRARIVKFLAAELDPLSDRDRVQVLVAVHDELAGRIAEWSPEGRASVPRGSLTLF